MSEPADTLRIKSAAELFAAITHPQPAVRIAVIARIGDAPEQARAFGAYQGKDVVDALIDVAGQYDRRERLGLLRAIQTLPDDRLAGFCAARLLQCTDDREAMLLFRYLAVHDLEWDRAQLQPLLWQTARICNAELAARLLVTGKLDSADRVRASAILGREAAGVLSFEPGLLPHWIEELAGPWADTARECLAAWGEIAWRALETCWERLDRSSQRWLVDWAVRRGMPDRESLIDRALESEANDVLVGALNDTETIAARPDKHAGTLCALLSDENPAVRKAAIDAGARPVDWHTMLESETDDLVLVAGLRAATKMIGADAVPMLVSFLGHEAWPVVAAATEALAGLDEPAARAVEPLLEHPALRLRIAADRVIGSVRGTSAARS